MLKIFSRHYVSFVASALLISAALGCAGLENGSGWEQKLAGNKLTRAQSSGSFGDTYHLWFCSSGEYMGKKETVGISYGGAGTGSMASESFERGKWSVTGSTLTIEPEGEGPIEYELSQGNDPNVIRFNGTPLLVSASSECR